MRGCDSTVSVMRCENESRSTASARPAGTADSSAAWMTSDPSRRISSFNSPTALAVESRIGASLPLLTEALRGAGALLTDEWGIRFMPAEHPLAELAPRDVVARAIHSRTRKGKKVFLDLRPVLSGEHGASFPQALQTATEAGFDPTREPLPIVPAAHYHMGGIAVDDAGRTSVKGLWACGEVATTGIHGANRLASNSLLEALVYARRVADEIHPGSNPEFEALDMMPNAPAVPDDAAQTVLLKSQESIRDSMTQYVGILRNGDDLELAYSKLTSVAKELREIGLQGSGRRSIEADHVRLWGETQNMTLVSRLVTLAALRRQESRGAHFRNDYPTPRPEWKRQQSLTVNSLHENNFSRPGDQGRSENTAVRPPSPARIASQHSPVP